MQPTVFVMYVNGYTQPDCRCQCCGLSCSCLDCIQLHTGECPLQQLWGEPSPCIQSLSPVPCDPDISGVEMESPHKYHSKEEFVTAFPGIGKISTLWVGAKGRDELKEIMKNELSKQGDHALRRELKYLVSECKKSFSESVQMRAPTHRSRRRLIFAIHASHGLLLRNQHATPE